MATNKLTSYIKPQFICLCTGLILIGLLAITGSSLAADDKWERKENMPESSRCCAAAATIGGIVYFIGGIEVNRAPHIPNPGDMTLDRVQAYDPATDTWAPKRDMPTRRARMAAVTFDGMIYVFGGADRRSGKVLDAVEVFNPEAGERGSWKKLAKLPKAVSAASAAVIGDKIYVIGGWDRGAQKEVYGTVFEYDPKEDKFKQKRDMPTPRGGLGAAAFGGKIYAIGGFDFEEGVSNIVEVYDPSTDKWEAKKPMPVSRALFGITTLSGRIFAIGGLGTFSDGGNDEVLKRVDVYNPANDEWVIDEAIPLPRGRAGVPATVAGGKIYVPGGRAGVQSFPSIYEYTPGSLSVSPQDKLTTLWGRLKQP